MADKKSAANERTPDRPLTETDSEDVLAEQITDPDPFYPAHPEKPQGVVVDPAAAAAAGDDLHVDSGTAPHKQ